MNLKLTQRSKQTAYSCGKLSACSCASTIPIHTSCSVLGHEQTVLCQRTNKLFVKLLKCLITQTGCVCYDQADDQAVCYPHERFLDPGGFLHYVAQPVFRLGLFQFLPL